jgi:hypothetical protein
MKGQGRMEHCSQYSARDMTDDDTDKQAGLILSNNKGEPVLQNKSTLCNTVYHKGIQSVIFKAISGLL